MNKLIIGVGILGIIAIGWFLFSSNSIEYVATATDEVSQLENELASLDTEVRAGTLSPEDAAQAQAKIVARIDAINGAAAAGQKTKLTDVQRAKLIDALERLRNLLIEHRDTLAAVDNAVLELPEDQRPKLKRRGGGGNSATTVANEAIEIIDEQVEEIIDDITDEEIVDEITEDLQDEKDDDTTSTDEEMNDDSATTSESETVEDDPGTTTDEALISAEGSVDIEVETGTTTSN